MIQCTLGHFSSHGKSAMTSTASAPPTPIHRPPRPPGKYKTVESVRTTGTKFLDKHFSKFISANFLTLIECAKQ